MKKEKKKLIVIGMGSRGSAYTKEAMQHPDDYEVVAFAEPIEARRSYMQKKLGLPDECVFETWEPLLALPKMADAAIIATMDRDHLAPAMAAIEKGYHLLLEKPAAPTPEECVTIERAANERGVHVLVCHVLRYTPFFIALKSILDEGLLGKVVCIQHEEGVGNTHQSHSFVRGNWGNSDRSTPMILQKSCHDMDILQWLIGKECKSVQSFGSLTYFTRENAPEGSPERCIDGCPHADTCPYNAVKLYLKDVKNSWFRGACTRMFEPTDADVERAMRETDYGKCVYKCDNNVVDHQVVNLEFEDGATVSFTMCAFTKGGRRLRIMGTKGELTAVFGSPTVTLFDFGTREFKEISIAERMVDDSIVGGHGGGDSGIMRSFHELLNGRTNNSLCEITTSVKNHMIAFAAEKSRLENRVVSMDEFQF